MKNLPRVPRPPRAPSPYTRHGKLPYKYPGADVLKKLAKKVYRENNAMINRFWQGPVYETRKWL